MPDFNIKAVSPHFYEDRIVIGDNVPDKLDDTNSIRERSGITAKILSVLSKFTKYPKIYDVEIDGVVHHLSFESAKKYSMAHPTDLFSIQFFENSGFDKPKEKFLLLAKLIQAKNLDAIQLNLKHEKKLCQYAAGLTDENGRNLLHLAAEYAPNQNLMNALEEIGVSKNQKATINDKTLNPYEIIYLKRFNNLLDMFKSNDQNKLLIIQNNLIGDANQEFTRYAAGLTDDNEWNLLHYAAEYLPNYDLMDKLIKIGVPINKMARKGKEMLKPSEIVQRNKALNVHDADKILGLFGETYKHITEEKLGFLAEYRDAIQNTSREPDKPGIKLPSYYDDNLKTKESTDIEIMHENLRNLIDSEDVRNKDEIITLLTDPDLRAYILNKKGEVGLLENLVKTKFKSDIELLALINTFRPQEQNSGTSKPPSDFDPAVIARKHELAQQEFNRQQQQKLAQQRPQSTTTTTTTTTQSEVKLSNAEIKNLLTKKAKELKKLLKKNDRDKIITLLDDKIFLHLKGQNNVVDQLLKSANEGRCDLYITNKIEGFRGGSGQSGSAG